MRDRASESSRLENNPSPGSGRSGRSGGGDGLVPKVFPLTLGLSWGFLTLSPQPFSEIPKRSFTNAQVLRGAVVGKKLTCPFVYQRERPTVLEAFARTMPALCPHCASPCYHSVFLLFFSLYVESQSLSITSILPTHPKRSWRNNSEVSRIISAANSVLFFFPPASLHSLI